MTPRPLDPADFAATARLWHDGWHEAHAGHVPADLVAARTLDRFLARVRDLGDGTRVMGPTGDPFGMCDIDGAELNQLFVSPRARGTGAAVTLLQDGEARLAAAGHARAHLFCLPENARAAAFYARQGWQDMGLFNMVPPDAGPVTRLMCIRFEKDLTAPPPK